jgi:hypothetical protein
MDEIKAHGSEWRFPEIRSRSPLPKNLRIGLRYRVDGVLHEDLGTAYLPDGESVAHVFLRNEWRPDTGGLLPLTLVDDKVVDESVSC